MKNSTRILIAVLIVAFLAPSVSAQLSAVGLSAVSGQSLATPSSDYLFAIQGGSMLTATTGIPYIGIAEYAYGVSNRTTIGVVFGETPDVEGYGIRVRTIIAELPENNRIYFRAPIFYYPQTHDLGGYPWFLAWPVVNIEHEYESGLRVWTGVGAVGAASQCTVENALGLDKDDDMDSQNKTGKGVEAGIWNTVQFGASKPFTDKLVAQAEFGLVMSGYKLASSSNWVGGPPVVFIMGVSYAL